MDQTEGVTGILIGKINQGSAGRVSEDILKEKCCYSDSINSLWNKVSLNVLNCPAYFYCKSIELIEFCQAMTEKLTNLLIGLQMSIFDSEVREDIYQVFKDCIGEINNLPESGVIITQVIITRWLKELVFK